MRKKDLIGFLNGSLFSEKIINMYFKILEKMNLVQLSIDNYNKQQQMLETSGKTGDRPSASNYLLSELLLATSAMKI